MEKKFEISFLMTMMMKSLCKGGGMKGYYVGFGYMGWVGYRYQLFATETEYIEFCASN